MKRLLTSHRVLICAGSGGVGKTTLSATVGICAAQMGLRTLVLTIDPAQRLAQALGITSEPGKVVSVPGVARLSALMIDPRREFDEFVLGSVDSRIAKGLFENRLYQQLVSNLNGSQEFTSLVRLLKASSSGEYDLVVLDTPPTQNAMDFLKAPERLYALFQDSVVGWFAEKAEASKENLLKRTFYRGTRMVTSVLEAMTGSSFIRELKDFFSHLMHLQSKVSEVSQDVHNLLHSEETGFLLVTGYDQSKLKDALEFCHDLRAEGLHLSGVILNRWFPGWVRPEKTRKESLWPSHWDRDPDFQKLKAFHVEFRGYFESRQMSFEKFQHQLAEDVPLIKLLEFKSPVQGMDDLQKMAEIVQKKWGGADADA
jgi:anion-transporting  ArsA/GET3 family ATPase